MHLKPHSELQRKIRHEPIDNPSDPPKWHYPWDPLDFENLASYPEDSCFAPTMAGQCFLHGPSAPA